MLKTPSTQDSLDTWLQYWGELHVTAIDLGLERVKPVAEYLGVLKPRGKVITVAGTNGKGSTTTSIASILDAAGYRVGLYQSPHIYRFNERIKLNGLGVSDTDLVIAFNKVEAARQACDLSLSFFEATTLAAFLIFEQRDCDVLVLEVGLGGRLDVVNLIDSDLAVITNIGLDHTDWLGNSIEQIAFEKAGIIRPKKPVVFAGEQPLPQAITNKVVDVEATLNVVGRDYVYKALEDDRQHWYFACAGHTLRLPTGTLALCNCAAAVAAVLLSGLKVDYAALAQGLINAKLSGRFEVREIQGRTVIFDAGHNPHGMQFLTQQLQQFLAYNSQFNSVCAVFSMLVDKDIEQVVDILKPVVNSWYVAELSLPRAAPIARLHKALSGQNIASFCTLQQAFADALAQCPPQQLLLVCGSFHTLEAVWEYLQHVHE